MLDSVIKVNKKYSPQLLLEECEYKIKYNKRKNFINDDLDPNSYDNYSDNGSDSHSDNQI